MFKHYYLLILIICVNICNAQTPSKEQNETKSDSIKKRIFIKHLANGYFPTKYFNFDLRYLVKYNQYEGIRTGIGTVTNDAFSNKFRINAYGVYGFRDGRYKYSIGGGFRIAPKTNTWLHISYTDDLQETGSTKFLTDGRSFQFFEPRLLNIDLFHKHVTKSVSLQHQLLNNLSTKTEFSVSKIDPTYQYTFNTLTSTLNNFRITMLKTAFNWTPVNSAEEVSDDSYPKFTLQYSKSIKNAFKSDFNFSKLDFRVIHKLKYQENNFTELTLVSGLANGDTPITHMYHAYPNNINKETILQRFSVAGLNSFETMYFNEFFSDKFTTFQLRHFLKPFNIGKHYKPQIVLISRYAIGDMEQPEKHQNITFGSLKKGYTESGLEINKLFFGFGLSFTYRYGAYHLPSFADNIALKFTFNVSL